MGKKIIKKFIVKHNLLELDRYVFPGCKSGIFHRPEQWPEEVKEKLAIAEAIAKIHSLNLLKGEIYLEEELPQLEIEAESLDSIKRFYMDWSEGIQFLEIKECESFEENEEKINLDRNGNYKETIKRLDRNKNHSPCVAGSRFVEIFPDGVVRGCEVQKLWDISTIGKVEQTKDIVDILNSKKAKDFSKIAKDCSCTFECANAISTVYDTKNWPSLV